MSARVIESPESLSPRQYYARGGEMRIGLTPNDVLLVPRAAPGPGREEQWGPGFTRVIIPDEAFDDPDFEERDLSTRLNADPSTFLDKDRRIELKVPIVSSPMIDVTESKMAIALGQEGGVGIVHRGLTIEEQAAEIRRVKEAMGYIYERPPTLPRSATVYDAREAMNLSEKGLVVITDPDDHVAGVITRRDVKKGWVADDLPLSNVLDTKPRKDIVAVTPEVEHNANGDIFVCRLTTGEKVLATDLMWQNRIEKLIIIDSEGRLAGAITDYDIRQRKEHPQATVDKKGRLVVGAAIGIKGKYIERTEALIDAGVDLLCVDTANAYQRQARTAIENVAKISNGIVIMAGSVATREGVVILYHVGATSIRGSIGSGSTCLTRGVSGFGVPSLTAILEMADEADKYGLPVIADGGVETSSDMAKFFAAGARAVMLGKVLAAAEESSAEIYIDPETGFKYKLYYGMASERSRRILEAADGGVATIFSRKQEGAPLMLAIKGNVAYIIGDLVSGLQSGMTYGGILTIEQLRNEVDFIRVTQSGIVESAVKKGDRHLW